uniref:PDZ domain-containing protein n=1 Tax=Strigamia maritima TaxID=126957 RepID=T1ISZ9_STRMM
MSLYPSLEDMKVDHMARAQLQSIPAQPQMFQSPSQPPINYPPYPPTHNHASYPSTPNQVPNNANPALYPILTEYMGLDLTPEFLHQHMPSVPQEQLMQPMTDLSILPPNQVVLPRSSFGMVAPLSCMSVGLKRAEVTHGIREVKLCKDRDGKVGLRVKDVSKGVFVALVQKNSPAALAGLRFGDQILQINGDNVAGYNVDKVHSIFKKLPVDGIRLSIRDRPFERTITLHKDSTGHIGFGYKEGKIILLVKDSSAARNGLLTDHHLLEVDGQNVVGLKDKDITSIIEGTGNIVTVTIMPSFLYEHMMKHMRTSIVKSLMDHSIPDL